MLDTLSLATHGILTEEQDGFDTLAMATDGVVIGEFIPIIIQTSGDGVRQQAAGSGSRRRLREEERRLREEEEILKRLIEQDEKDWMDILFLFTKVNQN